MRFLVLFLFMSFFAVSDGYAGMFDHCKGTAAEINACITATVGQSATRTGPATGMIGVMGAAQAMLPTGIGALPRNCQGTFAGPMLDTHAGDLANTVANANNPRAAMIQGVMGIFN